MFRTYKKKLFHEWILIIFRQCLFTFSATKTSSLNTTATTGYVGSSATIKYVDAVTNAEVSDLYLGDKTKVLIDYGKSLASHFQLRIKSCNLVTTLQTLPLISNGSVNQVVDDYMYSGLLISLQGFLVEDNPVGTNTK